MGHTQESCLENGKRLLPPHDFPTEAETQQLKKS